MRGNTQGRILKLAASLILLGMLCPFLAGCEFISDLLSPEKRAARIAYETYRKAMASGDRESLKKVLAREKAGEIDGPYAVEALQLAQSFIPPRPSVTEAVLSGEKGTLAVQSELEAGTMKGEVHLVKEEGSWKISLEKWDMIVHPYPVTLSGGEMAPPFEPVTPDLISPGMFFGLGVPDSGFEGGAKSLSAQLTLKGHEGEVTDIAFTPDGRHLMSSSYGDFTIRMWDTAKGRETAMVKIKHRPTGMDITPDGTMVVIADAYENITFVPLENNGFGIPSTLDAKTGKNSSLSVSPNGRLFATAGFDRFLTIGNLDNRNLIRRIDMPEPMRKVSFSPSGELLAATTNTNKFVLWNLREGTGRTYTVPKVDKSSDVSSIAFSPDNKYVATGHMDSSITIWDVRKQKELHNYFVPGASTYNIRFSPDGKILATAHANSKCYLWGTKSAQKLAELSGHGGPVRSVAFSPDGQTIATGSEDRTVILWK